MAQLVPELNSVFPNENIAPSKKVEYEFLFQIAQAAYTACGRLPVGAIGWPSRIEYERIMAYVNGRQDVDQYRRKLAMDMDPTDEGVLITEDTIIPIVPKYLNIAISLIEKQQGKLMINTIDPEAAIELKGKQNERKARLLLRRQFQMNGMPEMAAHPEIAKQQGDPDDLESLEIMAMGERLPITADAQDAVRAILNMNDYDELRRMWISSLINYGVAVTKDETEPCGITIRSCDMRGIVMSYCAYSDFRDLKYIGEIRTVPVSALEEMSAGQIKRSDFEMLYQNNSGTMWYSGINGMPTSLDSWYGTAKVNVLELEFRSIDTIESEESKDDNGNIRYGNATQDPDKRKKKAEKGSKFNSISVENWYTVKWIIGTDICYDLGKKAWMPRDQQNPARAVCSYHIAATGLHNMVPYSRAKSLIPMADGLQMTAYRRQRAINRVKGTTYEVDVAKLEGIDISAGGEKLSWGDIIEMWKEEDISLFRSRLLGGGRTEDSGGAIRAIPGGIGQELSEYRVIFTDYVDLIKSSLGLNDLTDGSTPGQKTLNGVASLAAQGTNNALADVSFADKKMKLKLNSSILLRIQDLIRLGRGDEIAAIIGSDSTKGLGEAPPLDQYHLGITIQDDPTPEQDQDFRQSLAAAMQAMQISVDEQFMAYTLYADNMQKGQLYLAHRVRKNKEEASQEAARREQSNAQLQQQSAQQASQARLQELQAENQLKSQMSAQEHQQKMSEINAEGQFSLEKERIASTGRVEASFVQAKERDTSNIRTNTTKLISEGQSSQKESINIPADLESRVEPLTSEQNPNLPKSAFTFLGNSEKPAGAAIQQQQQPPMPEQQARDNEGAEPPQSVAPEQEQMQ